MTKSLALLAIFFMTGFFSSAQNRWSFYAEGTFSGNELYRAYPLSINGEFKAGVKRRVFLRAGFNMTNLGHVDACFPVVFGFFTRPEAKNHFETGIGTVFFMTERLSPYDELSNYDFGPSGILVPLIYRRDFPKGWFMRLGLSPFISFDSSIIPSLSFGYQFKKAG